MPCFHGKHRFLHKKYCKCNVCRTEDVVAMSYGIVIKHTWFNSAVVSNRILGISSCIPIDVVNTLLGSKPLNFFSSSWTSGLVYIYIGINITFSEQRSTSFICLGCDAVISAKIAVENNIMQKHKKPTYFYGSHFIKHLQQLQKVLTPSVLRRSSNIHNSGYLLWQNLAKSGSMFVDLGRIPAFFSLFPMTLLMVSVNHKNDEPVKNFVT